MIGEKKLHQKLIVDKNSKLLVARLRNLCYIEFTRVLLHTLYNLFYIKQKHC